MTTDIKNTNNWRENETYISNLHHWISKFEIKTKFFTEDGIHASIIADNTPLGSNIDQFDFEFIESIINNIDSFFEKAIRYIQYKSFQDSELFGISKNRSEENIKIPIDKFPVFFPDIVFYHDKTWMIRFADADFPNIEYRLGISVSFEEYNITGLDILSYDNEIKQDNV